MSHLKVSRKRCNQCLFSNQKIVDEQRKADVLTECAATDSHFICHKYTVAKLLGKLKDDNVVCRGFYDNDPNASTWMQIAGRLDLIEFVDLPEESE